MNIKENRLLDAGKALVVTETTMEDGETTYTRRKTFNPGSFQGESISKVPKGKELGRFFVDTREGLAHVETDKRGQSAFLIQDNEKVELTAGKKSNIKLVAKRINLKSLIVK